MADEKMVKVKVRVPSREAQGFPGFWSVGRHWPNGDSEAVIPESKLEELKAEQLLAVMSVDAAPSDAGASSPQAPAVPPAGDGSLNPGSPTGPAAEESRPGKPLRK
jgi:hypothetical protein